jgi:NitT/TauT family transport system substrate-binding protein
MRSRRIIALFAAFVVVAACSGGGAATVAPASQSAPSASAATSEAPSAPAELKPIRLQLQWFPQAQFAGYFAAKDKGYYAEEGFDVTILPGAVEIVPATVVAGGQAEFGISWVPPTAS